MKNLICFAFVACASLAQAVSVSNVSARQRWPWNNLVDVSFDVSGASGAAYSVEVRATCADGKQEMTARTLLSEPIAKDGANKLVWDFGADYPNFRADDMKVSVLVTPFSASTSVYLIIDVSGGTAATSYPVRYTTVDPVHTAGDSDPCKTTEIWLKRVKAGGGTVSGNAGWGFKGHAFNLTEDYYLGIFPVTQAQWEKVGSGVNKQAHHSFFTNTAYAATRPVDNLGYWTIYGSITYVDRYAPNAWGFYSMLGNVYEWTGTADGWADALVDGTLPDDYKGPNPTSAAQQGNRFLQGGSWASSEEQTRYYSAAIRDSYNRNGVSPNEGTQGFRICLTIPNAAK